MNNFKKHEVADDSHVVDDENINLIDSIIQRNKSQVGINNLKLTMKETKKAKAMKKKAASQAKPQAAKRNRLNEPRVGNSTKNQKLNDNSSITWSVLDLRNKYEGLSELEDENNGNKAGNESNSKNMSSKGSTDHTK